MQVFVTPIRMTRSSGGGQCRHLGRKPGRSPLGTLAFRGPTDVWGANADQMEAQSTRGSVLQEFPHQEPPTFSDEDQRNLLTLPAPVRGSNAHAEGRDPAHLGLPAPGPPGGREVAISRPRCLPVLQTPGKS